MKSKVDLVFERFLDRLDLGDYYLLLESKADRLKEMERRLMRAGRGNPTGTAQALVDLNDPKREKGYFEWIVRGFGGGVFPPENAEDLEKMRKAYDLVVRQGLDVQKFSSPDDVLNRMDNSTRRISAKLEGETSVLDPESLPGIHDGEDVGGGCKIYLLDETWEAMESVRKIIDVYWRI